MKIDFDMSQLEENAGQATAFLKALSNPNRLMVLCNLVDGEMTSGELAEQLGISHPNLSQHLAKLKAEKLVSTERSATTITYRIADPRIAQIISVLYEMFCAPGAKKD
jgi:ArsR family transcriptional regulator, virulence genes transcriptional regulator